MGLQHLMGTDHVVVAARDLDAAASRWQRLGFTLSPRGTHSPLLGTANHTIMFGTDYIELLGVLADTDQNRPTREFLAVREGIERTAFTTDDAAAGAAELHARGVAAFGPIAFARPVSLPGAATGTAQFNMFGWPSDDAPGGLRIFACQHLTRDTVWVPALQKHANEARRLVHIEILSSAPESAAEHMARLLDQSIAADWNAWRVPSGGRRADFVFYDQVEFARRYPAAVRAGAAPEGAVALVIATADLTAAGDTLAELGVAHGGSISVPAQEANGVVVSFTASW